MVLERCCIFLDIDGTLVDFASMPSAVRIDRALADLLERLSLSLDGALAIVSGRRLEEIDRLFAPRRWPAAGLHGLERRDAAGRTWMPQIGRTELANARAMIRAVAAQYPGVLIEDKGVSLAVHYRQVPELEEDLRLMLEQLVRDLGEDFHLQPGACVLELKLRGPSKAEAIRAFLGEPPFAGRVPLFAGDDLTDTEGFAEVERAGGLSISVGDRVAGRLRLASPAELRSLLAGIAATGSVAERDPA